MKDIFHAVIFGFKEILTWNTIKYALVSGTVVIALWLGIGYLLWDIIISISTSILELVPFSMVRSNGAWMLSAFLWLQITLLTFAILFSLLGNLILQSVSKERYTTFSLLIILLSAIFWSIVWFYQGGYIYQQFLKLLTSLPFQTVENGIAYLIAFYFIYNGIIVTMFFITSLLNEPLILNIEKRHFQDKEVIRDNLFRSMGYTIKDTLLFSIASIIALPLLFIPILNIFIQIALWIWLIKDTITYDTLSLTHKKVDKKMTHQHKIAIWFISFLTALFNFVPILNILGSYFGEITMFHYFKTINASKVA